MAEVPEMHSNTNVRVNWFNVNVPTILTVLGVGWGVATYVADMQQRISGVENSVGDTQTSLDNLVSIPYRMTNVEGQIVQTNARLDRLIENLTGSVEALRKDVNTVGTKVEVLTSKIDNLSPTDKTNFRARLIPLAIRVVVLLDSIFRPLQYGAERKFQSAPYSQLTEQPRGRVPAAQQTHKAVPRG